jgi:hypothetical protein
MKNLRTIFAMLLLCFVTTQVNAQGNSQNENGNAVLSEVDAYNNGDGTSTLVMKISGNLSDIVDGVKMSVTGDLIPGGIYTTYIDHSKFLIPNPIFAATIPIKEFSNTTQGNPNEWVDVEIEYYIGPYKTKKSKKARMPKDVVKVAY